MKYAAIGLLLVALSFGSALAGPGDERPVVRPYLGLGSMLNAPSAEALGYIDADGGNLDEYLEHDKGGLCFGVQILVPWKPQLRLGGELGYRRLFKSTFNTGSSDLDFINEDYDTDTEHDLSLLGLIEYSLEPSNFFLLGGAGMHIVRWEFESEYESSYSSADSFDSGTGTNFGLMGAAGMNFALTPKLTLPVMVRLDYILRYDDLFPVSVSAGLQFQL